MYYEIIGSNDEEKVETFFEENDICYVVIDRRNVISDEDTLLENASINELWNELNGRENLLYSFISDCLKSKEDRRTIILEALELNSMATNEDIIERIQDLFR